MLSPMIPLPLMGMSASKHPCMDATPPTHSLLSSQARASAAKTEHIIGLESLWPLTFFRMMSNIPECTVSITLTQLAVRASSYHFLPLTTLPSRLSKLLKCHYYSCLQSSAYITPSISNTLHPSSKSSDPSGFNWDISSGKSTLACPWSVEIPPASPSASCGSSISTPITLDCKLVAYLQCPGECLVKRRFSIIIWWMSEQSKWTN